jgi:hypothetical protein
MNKDQRLLEEAYQSICESLKEPLYFGPPDKKEAFMNWLKRLNHEVHEDGSVSVKGDVDFRYNEQGQFRVCVSDNIEKYIVSRLPFNFRKVTGDFMCPKQIMTLTGSPRHVGGTFTSGPDNQNISSLEGAPDYVGKDFWCMSTLLKSLEGAPEVIKGYFGTKWFSKDDYREYAEKAAREKKIKKKLDKELDKDLNVDLEDFS